MSEPIERIEHPNNQQTEALTALIRACNDADGTAYAYEFYPDYRRPGQADAFLIREAGVPAAAAVLFAPHSHEVELTAVTLPALRRRGYFSAIVRAVRAELAERPARSVLFVNDRRSAAGKAAIAAQGARYEFSEYAMEAAPGDIAPVDGSTPVGFALHAAEPAQQQALVELAQRSFGSDYEASHVELMFASDTRTPFAILYRDTVIGLIGAMEDVDHWSLYSFCVAPEHRGKGYGAAALRGVADHVRTHSPQKAIKLEVETQNESALGLYQAVGFSVASAFDYYRLALR